MSEPDDKFLSRWSRRKAEAQLTEPEPSPDPSADRAEGTDAEQAPDEAAIVAELPDIESLDKDSDFSAFMKQGVPQALRRQALRKLWKVNPVFGFLDGMNEYDEDFTITTAIGEGVKTIYQVGKGMVREEEDPVAAEDAGAEAEAADSAPPEEPEDSEATADRDADAPAEESAEDRQAAPEPAPEVAATDGAGEDAGEDAAAPPAVEEPAKQPVAGSAAQRRWGGFRT